MTGNAANRVETEVETDYVRGMLASAPTAVPRAGGHPWGPITDEWGRVVVACLDDIDRLREALDG